LFSVLFSPFIDFVLNNAIRLLAESHGIE